MNFKKLLTILSLIVFSLGFASNVTQEHTEKQEKYNPVPFIMHHIQDSHVWHFWGEGENSAQLHLPIILWDGGLKIFSSSNFGHPDKDGKTKTVERGGNFYTLFHEKIYKTNHNGDLEFDEHHHPLNKQPIDLSITKNVAQMLLGAIILLIIGIASASSYKKSSLPSGIGRFIEPLVLFIRDDIALENIGNLRYKKYVPYLTTLFLFIWILNILGLFPGAANTTGNIAFTLTLSVFTLLIVNLSGRKTYWSHMFDPLGKDMPIGGKILIYIILIPVELLGIITKPFALMIRLFANMTAGHIIIMSLLALIFIMKTYLITPVALGMSLFIYTLEVLVAALQAYIFTMLTALFIGSAVEEPHHDH